MEASKEKVVQIHYTLKNANGEILDSSDGQDPMTYLHGCGQIIPGLESCIEGKKAGDTLEVSIKPEEGYGDRSDEMIKSIPLTEFEDVSLVTIGAQFQLEGPGGVHMATVLKIENEEAMLDLNHPLAGETLNFKVDLVDVRAATEEELSHGHVHGPGGHQH